MKRALERRDRGSADISAKGGSAPSQEPAHEYKEDEFGRTVGRLRGEAQRKYIEDYYSREGKPAGKSGGEYPSAAPGGLGPEYFKQHSMLMHPHIGARLAANISNRHSTVNNSASNQVHVGNVHINTPATDVSGIARDIKPAIERTSFALSANYSLA